MNLVPFIVDRNSLEAMNDAGPRGIDAFLLRHIRELREEYRRQGNPYIIYLAGLSLLNAVSSVPRCNQSFQVSQLHGFLGELLIAAGRDAASLRAAIDHLEIAIEIVSGFGALSPDIVRARIFFALLHAVALKALGRFDDSLSLLRQASANLRQKWAATTVELTPLQRQLVIMEQRVVGYNALVETAVSFRDTHPVEYYRSLKRVFEFFLNRGRIREASEIVPELKRAYGMIATQAPPLVHISFLKNIGQFLMSTGEVASAVSLFLSAIREAKRLGLHGQYRQLALLLDEARAGGGHGQLVTFRVDDVDGTR